MTVKTFDKGLDTGNYIGVDPDLHNTAMACVGWNHIDQRFIIQSAVILKVPSSGKYKRTGYNAVQSMYLLNLHMLQHNLETANGGFAAQNAAVEGQIIIPRSKQRPHDIMHLAMATNQTCMALVPILKEPEKLIHALPLKWKGSTPKIQHQARMCKNMLRVPFERRVGYVIPQLDYEVPVLIWAIKGTDVVETKSKGSEIGAAWKHLTDAVGLAIYAKTKIIT